MDKLFLEKLEKGFAEGRSLEDVEKRLKQIGATEEFFEAARSFYESKKKVQPNESVSESKSTSAPTPSTSGSKTLQQQLAEAEPLPKDAKVDVPVLPKSPQSEQAIEAKPIPDPSFEQKARAFDVKEYEKKNQQRLQSAFSVFEKINSNENASKEIASYRSLGENLPKPLNEDGSVNEEFFSYLQKDAAAYHQQNLKKFLAPESRLSVVGKQFMATIHGLALLAQEMMGRGVYQSPEEERELDEIREALGMDPIDRTRKGHLYDVTMAWKDLANDASFRNLVHNGYSVEQIQKGPMLTALEDGDFGMLGLAMLDQIPQLLIAAASRDPKKALVAIGALAAGQSYAEVLDDPDFSEEGKVLYAVSVGIAEGITELAFKTDINQLRKLFGKRAIKSSEIAETLFKWIPDSNAGRLLKSTLEESIEEGLVGVVEETLGVILGGKDFSVSNIGDQMFVGSATGGSIHAVTRLPSAVLNMANAGKSYEIRNRIAEIQTLLEDESLSESEKSVLEKRLMEDKENLRKIRKDAERFYEAFSEEDLRETLEANQAIDNGLRTYKESENALVKEQALKDVKEAVDKKNAIESKYSFETTTEEGSGPAGFRPKRVSVTSENASAVVKGFSRVLDGIPDKAFTAVGTSKEAAKRGLGSVKNIVDAFSKEGKDVDVVVHATADSFMKATDEESVSRGMHIRKEDGGKNEIHLYAPAMADNTAYHEALHEAIPEAIGEKGVDKFLNGFMRGILQGRDVNLYGRMMGFLSTYGVDVKNFNFNDLTDAQKDEMITEIGAMIAAGDIDVNLKDGIGTRFLKALDAALGKIGVNMNMQPTTQQISNALSFMAENLATGRAVGVEKARRMAKTDRAMGVKAGSRAQPVSGNRLFNEPLPDAKRIADEYFQSAFGSARPVFEGVRSVDVERAKRIAKAYEDMKDNYSDPEVKAAYDAMVKETLDQYEFMVKNGYSVEINNEEPYSSAQDMIDDLRSRRVMKIFSTESGFGDSSITNEMRKSNPLLKDSGMKDSSGETLLVNDVFRAVHDFFGHSELGNGFGAVGEENAWNVHARMYSPLARKAMTSETRGQNSYVNFSGVNDEAFKLRDQARELRKAGKTKEADEVVSRVYDMMKFADQKVGLLPEFAYQIDLGEGTEVSKRAQAVVKTNEVEVSYAPKGNYLNIGMMAGTTNQPITDQMIKDGLPSDVEIQESFLKESQVSEIDGEERSEPTTVLKISRPLTDAEMQSLLDATDQIAIPALYDGVGQMFGSERYDDFSPEFFSMMDGKNLSSMDESSAESFIRDIMTEPNTGSGVGAFKIKKTQRIAPSLDEDSRGFIRSLVKAAKMEDFNGMKFVTSMYDQTTAGNALFPSGVQIELFGGAHYAAFMLARNGRKIGDYSNVSAFNSQTNAFDFVRNAQESGATLYAATAGADGSWQFQSRLFTQVIGLLRSSGKFSDSKILGILNDGIKMIPNKEGVMVYRKYSKNTTNIFENLSALAKSKGIPMKNFNHYRGRLDELISDLEATEGNMSSSLRKDIIGILIGDENVRSTIFGIKHQNSFYKNIIDQLNVGAKFGDIMSIVQFDPSTLEVRKTKKGDLDHHDSFGWTVYGKINGIYRPDKFHSVIESTESIIKFNKNSTVQYDFSQKEFYNQFAGTASSLLKVGEVKIKKAQAITADNSANYANLTEDGNGNFVFYHFSDQKFDAPDPNMAGKNRRNITSREEKAALSTAGPVAMFYTDIKDREGLVSSEFGYEVRVPMDRVYDLDTDPLGFEAEARERFKKQNPSQAFGASQRAFAITAVAAENGYDMAVGRWTRGLTRAHAAIKLPVTDRMVLRGKNKKDFNEVFESNKDKGWEGVSPDAAMGPVYDAYTRISWERGDAKNYDDIYRLYYEYSNYTQEEITDMINSSDLSADSKKAYNDALSSVPSKHQSVKKKAQKKSQGGIEQDAKLYLIDMSELDQSTGNFKPSMTENDFVGLMSMTIPEDRARAIYQSVVDGTGTENIVAAAYTRYLSDVAANKKEATVSLMTLRKLLTDAQADIKALLREAEMNNAIDLLVTKAGHGSIAKFFWGQYEKDVYKGLSSEDIAMLDQVIFARRVIQIDDSFDKRGDKRPKHPNGMDKESAEVSLAKMRAENPKLFDKADERATRYFNAFRAMLLRSYENGLITEDTYNMFRDFDYQPRVFLEHVFEDFDSLPADMRNSSTKELIRAIKDGSTESAMMDSRFLLAAYVSSLESRIAKNKSNVAIAEAVGKSGTDSWISEKERKGFSKLVYFKDGLKKEVYLRDDIKKSLDNTPFLSQDAAKYVGMFTGASLLKAMATAINPLFVATNIPRDYAHILFFTDVYDNTPLPISMLKLAKDALSGTIGKITKSDLYRDWIMHGGGMEFLSVQGRPNLASVTGRKVSNALSYLGETSEIAFRLGVYKRSVERGISDYKKENKGKAPSPEELAEIKVSAARVARELIDFAQGGRAVKAAEPFTPYINAAFQGFRVASDYIAKNPAMFAAKVAQAFVGIAGLMMYNLSYDDDDMANISEHIRKRYFVVLLPWKEEDPETGEMRRKYYKIAKTQQLTAFINPLEQIAYEYGGEMMGRKTGKYFSESVANEAIDGFLTEYLPVGPTKQNIMGRVPPLVRALYTYNANYDAFRDRVVSMDKGTVEPQFEGINDKNVEYLYKAIGAKLSISPKRTKAAAESVITSPMSSLPVGISYMMLDAAAKMADVEVEGKYGKISLRETSNPVLDNFKRNTSRRFFDTIDPKASTASIDKKIAEINMEAGSARKQIKIEADRISKNLRDNDYSKEAIEQAKIDAKKLIRNVADTDKSEVDYAIETVKNRISKKPHDRIFTEVKYAKSDEAKAKILIQAIGKNNDDELKRFMIEMRRANGYRLKPQTISKYRELSK